VGTEVLAVIGREGDDSPKTNIRLFGRILFCQKNENGENGITYLSAKKFS
jgi:hypothetical protein